MDTFWGLSGTAWTAIYTILTLLLLLTAWGAAYIAWGQWKASRDAVEDARKAQLEASRPYILVTAEPSAASRRLFDLSIRNIGKRPALKVEVRLDPPPERAKEIDGREFAKMKMLNEPIAMIAPGQDMRAYWDSHLERHGVEMPTSHTVHLTYKDTSGAEYSETSVIDLDAMQGSMFTEVETVHDVGQSLDEIKKVLKAAPVLSRNGSVHVQAVTESREANEDRQLREDYGRLLATLEATRAASWQDPKQIAAMEAKAARLEAAHPHLKQVVAPMSNAEDATAGVTGGAFNRLRLDLVQRMRTLLHRR